MVKFRELKLGDVLDFKGTDGYDGDFEEHGIVTEICEDHAIVTDIRDVRFNGVLKGVNYWLDDDTAFMFFKSELEYDWEYSKIMHKGDYVRTPRFGFVKLEDVFANEDDARNAGYYEPTHYEFDHDNGWNILGKTTGWNEMEFAAYMVGKE